MCCSICPHHGQSKRVKLSDGTIALLFKPTNASSEAAMTPPQTTLTFVDKPQNNVANDNK